MGARIFIPALGLQSVYHAYGCKSAGVVARVGATTRALYSFEYALCVLHNTPMRVYVSLVCVFVDFIAFRRTAVVRINSAVM